MGAAAASAGLSSDQTHNEFLAGLVKAMEVVETYVEGSRPARRAQSEASNGTIPRA